MKIGLRNLTRFSVPAAEIRGDLIRIRSFPLIRTRPEALGVVFIAPDESRRLNKRYLGKSGPANVLAFRYPTEAEIILTPSVVRREAKALGIPIARHFRRMAAHGFLHVLGYHHESSPGAARRFRRVELSLLKRLGLAGGRAGVY